MGTRHFSISCDGKQCLQVLPGVLGLGVLCAPDGEPLH